MTSTNISHYSYVYAKKGVDGRDGTLLCFNIHLIYPECIPEKAAKLVKYYETSQRGIVMNFGDVFTIATTHLKAKAEFDYVRFAQIQELLMFANAKNVLLCGDFNEPETGSVLAYTKSKGFVNCIETTWTTCKTRQGKTKICNEDYVMMKGSSFRVDSILTVPDLGKSTQLLSTSYPSDHIALAVKFSF